MSGAIGKADVLEQLARPLPPLGRRHAGFRLRQLDVLGGSEHRQQEEALKHETDPREANPAALAFRQSRHVAVLEQDRTGGRRVDAANQVQKR